MRDAFSSALRPQGGLRPHAPESVRAGARISKNSVSVFRCLLALVALVTAPVYGCGQESSSALSHASDEYTLNVNVNMVVLHASVQDHNHVLVSGLDNDDFQVYEDGALQQVKQFSREDVPVTVGLVVDNSGSMKSKRADVIAAALAFARSSNPQDQMFVVMFNEKVSFGLPGNTPFTDNVAQLEGALSRIAADGQTALYDAVAAALEHLKKGSRDKRVLIVVSDGGDNRSKHTQTEIMTRVRLSDAIIYTIGIFGEEDPDRNPGVLQRLAKDAGGEAFFPESFKGVVPICEQIAHDIRNQYTLAYVPTNRKRDGTYRLIRVKAHARGHRGLSVRTRPGYFAPPPLPSTAGKTVDHEDQN